MFDLLLYSFLQFECKDDNAEPITEEAACRQPRSSNCVVFFRPRPSVKWNSVELTNASCFNILLCAASMLHCLAWYYLPFPPATIFSNLSLMKSLESLPGESCVGPLGGVFFCGSCHSSDLDLFGFWTSDIRELATSCTKLLCIISSWYQGF